MVTPTIDGNTFTADLVNLSAYSGITELVLANTDGGGIGYDDFNFTVAASEPASMSLI